MTMLLLVPLGRGTEWMDLGTTPQGVSVVATAPWILLEVPS